MGHGNMSHKARREKGLFPSKRSVNELVDDDKSPWLQFFPQRTDCTYGEDITTTGSLKSGDIRPVINPAGRNSVANTVTRQKDGFRTMQRAAKDPVRGGSECRSQPPAGHASKAIDLIKTTASDNPNPCRFIQIINLLRRLFL
jgi:hypothetical protein